MGRRITRKQLKEDEFVSVVDTFIRWFADRWQPVAIIAVALVGATILWWGVGKWSGSRADKASYALTQAVAVYEEAQAAPDGDLTAAEQALEQVTADFGRTDQADTARLYLARIQVGRGELEGARERLVAVADRQQGTALGRLATLDLIHLRIASGQGGEVAQELEAMVAGRDPRLPRDVALYELGRLYADEDNRDQAREYLQMLLDEFPESPYRGEAQRRLDELG